VRLSLLALLACPAAFAGPLKPGASPLSVRLEGLFGQPTTRYPVRGGGAIGLAFRLTDQISAIGDVGQRAAPGGGLTTVALGLQATLDSTPIAPSFELSFLTIAPRDTAGYTLATRTGFGADWTFARGFSLGVVVRQYVAFDPALAGDVPGGTEAALRFIYTPGGN
jgi:hypothetical protein